MVELLKTNDPVLLSYIQHVLAEEGIEAHVFDGYISAVEGSIGAFPRRVMVRKDDVETARRALGNIALTIDG
jgi:hypothetical protein